MRNKTAGYTLIEMILGMVLIMASIAGVYFMLSRANANAAIETEQRQACTIVQAVRGAYAPMGGYEGLTTADFWGLDVPGVKPGGGEEATIKSDVGTATILRPATVRAPNDAFDMVYYGLGNKQCVALVKALYAQSYTIFVNESSQVSTDAPVAPSVPGTQVQMTVGAAEGRLVNEQTLTQLCSEGAFDEKRGVVAFRFYEGLSGTPADVPTACLCSPETENQNLVCPAGEIGSLTQTRSSACTGGTPECRTPVWTAWATTNDTCAPAPNDCVTNGTCPVVTAPDDVCVPHTDTRVTACPAGTTGTIIETQAFTCPSATGAPVPGPWSAPVNTCVPNTDPPATPCTPSTRPGTPIACPAGQGGMISTQQSSTCATPTSTPVWGANVPTINTCSTSCVVTGNCCQPEDPQEQTTASCPAGQFGFIDYRSLYECQGPTTQRANWGVWFPIANHCSACPAPVTSWLNDSATCPSGQSGSHTWQYRRVASYNCPYGTPNLPGITITDSPSVIQNEVNTCAANCVAPAATVDYRDGGACPSGQTGTITEEQTTSWTCPTTTGSPVSSASGWTVSSNTCVGTCVPPANTTAQRTSTPCPPGEVGVITEEQTTSWTCPTTTGSPVSSASGWTVVNSTCVPSTCTGNSSENQWVNRTGTCAANETGATAWQAGQTRNRACNSGTWDDWGAWADNGTTQNHTSTCVPTCGAAPSSGTRTLACPTGYTGSITQTSTWGAAASPTCWTESWATTNNTCVVDWNALGISCEAKAFGGTFSDDANRKFSEGKTLKCTADCKWSGSSVNTCKNRDNMDHVFRFNIGVSSDFQVIWTGDCSSTVGNNCQITGTGAKREVSGQFTLLHTPTGEQKSMGYFGDIADMPK